MASTCDSCRTRPWTMTRFVLCWLLHCTSWSERQMRNDCKSITLSERTWCPVHLRIRQVRRDPVRCCFPAKTIWIQKRFPTEKIFPLDGGILQEKNVTKKLKGEKKVVEITRHRSGFTLKSKFTQHNFHYTCNLASHGSLEDSIKISFFFLNGGKKPLHHDSDIDHVFVVLRFAEPPQFLNTVNWWILSFGNALNPEHHDKFLHHFESTIGTLNNSVSKTSVLSLSVVFIWRLFVSVSPSVLFHQSHTSSSLPNPHLIFCQWIYFYSKTVQGCIHFALVIWHILSFSIVGLVLRPSIVWYKLGLCMGSHSCALRRWREPRWLHLPSLLVSSSKSMSCFPPIFVFLARSSFDLRHRPFNPPGSASPPQVAKSFQQLFATCWGGRVNIKRVTKKRERT